MRHQDLTLNHILESWVYANATARTTAGGFVSGDIGRISYQTDTGQYWRLTATTPTWQLIGTSLIETWVYANAAARLGATGFVSSDQGRIAYQTDTGQYWRLQNYSPIVWTIINVLESWTYANAAARTGATGFNAANIGEIAYQSDTGEYWRLTATTPTWACIAGSTVTLQIGVTSPTGTTSLTSIMMGLAGVITPVRSGKVFVTISGRMSNNTVNNGYDVSIRYGTGAAPANGAAITGTAIGGTARLNGVSGVGFSYPFSLSAVITGLTLGTPIWLDLIQAAVTGGTAAAFNVSVSAFELP
jgi:hypothetical protein